MVDRKEGHTSRALLIDFGGVLTTSVRESFAAFCREEGIGRDAFLSAVFGGDGERASPVERVETGALTADDFDREVAERLSAAVGRAIEHGGLKQRLFATVQPDVQMRDAVRRARGAGIATALVSNSWGGQDYPLDELEPLFDAVLISGHLGMRKPEPGIYLAAAERVAVEPSGCVFVDDLQHNVAGAEAVGMAGVLHRDTPGTLERLEALLAVPLRARPR